MGSSPVLRSKVHLEKKEIQEITLQNDYILSLRDKSKDGDKLISLKELNSITNGIILGSTIESEKDNGDIIEAGRYCFPVKCITKVVTHISYDFKLLTTISADGKSGKVLVLLHSEVEIFGKNDIID